MKTELRNVPPRKTIINYPCLMIRERDGVVVLFTKLNTGTCVFTSNTSEVLGYHSTNWFMCEFVSLDGELVLSN
jgi:hypothetical protein